MKNIISIIDQYISPTVLPKEQTSCWIKWKKGANFDKIVIRYEADVKLYRLFNIDEDVFEDHDDWKGKVTIPKSKFQIDGFFGFTSRYIAVPTTERKISYEIDIISGDKTQTIHLDNLLTRPMIKVVKSTPERIQISDMSPQLAPFSVNIKIVGKASINNLSYFLDLITTDKLIVDITTSKKTQSKEITLKDEQLTSQNIVIKGKGNGLIRLGANYEDDYGTKYEDILNETPIIVEQEQHQIIPIAEQVEKQEKHLLTIPN